MNTITVYFRQNALSVYQAVADALGLKDRQTLLTEAHFWTALRANTSFGISICEHEMQHKDN